MITIHHLNDSRSQRILWLLEELDLPYDLVCYQRDATTRLAPPELKAVHPLGKSPVLTEHNRTIIESGAIIEYVLRHHGAGRLQPQQDHADYDLLCQWLHYAEGSAMLPLMLRLYVGRLGEAGAALQPRIESELANHLGYVDHYLADRPYLLGQDFTAADIQMSFVGEIAGVFGLRSAYPHMEAWVARLQARDAYQRALARGGPYAYGQ